MGKVQEYYIATAQGNAPFTIASARIILNFASFF